MAPAGRLTHSPCALGARSCPWGGRAPALEAPLSPARAQSPRGGAGSSLRPSGMRLWEPSPGRCMRLSWKLDLPGGRETRHSAPKPTAVRLRPSLHHGPFLLRRGVSKASMQLAADGDSRPQCPQSGCPWKLGSKHGASFDKYERQTRTESLAEPGVVRGAEDTLASPP